MTLILLYANETHAYVAADRRLTYPNLSVTENDRTKLLAWCGGLVFGFTGQAFLIPDQEKVSAPMWLARAISEQEGSGRINFDLIAERLTSTPLEPGGDGRLAFGSVGFVGGGVPTSVLVSNMHDEEGRRLSRPNPSFRALGVHFEGHFFRTLGGRLSPSAREMLRTRLPVAFSNPKAVPQLLAGAIERSTSRTIGKQSLVTTMVRNPPPGKGSIVCDLVIPNHRGPRNIADLAMPIMVGRGGVIMNIHHRRRDWPDP